MNDHDRPHPVASAFLHAVVIAAVLFIILIGVIDRLGL